MTEMPYSVKITRFYCGCAYKTMSDVLVFCPEAPPQFASRIHHRAENIPESRAGSSPNTRTGHKPPCRRTPQNNDEHQR